MKRFAAAVWASLCIGLAACEKAADISSPLVYDTDGVSFSYPGNWQVTEDTTEQGFRYVFVESPGDAIFIIQLYQNNFDLSLRQFAEDFSSGARNELTIIGISDSTFESIEKAGFSAAIRERVSLNWAGESIPHIRDYYMREAGPLIVYVIAQVATEDLAMVEPGFDLILASFRVK